VVAGLLTLGCLLNRRKTSELQKVAQSPLPSRPTHLGFYKYNIRIPDTTPYEGRLVSRFLARFPFLMEVWYWCVCVSYPLVRLFCEELLRVPSVSAD